MLVECLETVLEASDHTINQAGKKARTLFLACIDQLV